MSLLFTLIFHLCHAETNPISCEKFERLSWFDGVLCVIRNTSIDSNSYVIESEKNEPICLDFFQNKNIFYLPIGLHKSFPVLKEIHARSCSIKAVFTENFKNLDELTFLDLSYNKIESIDSSSIESLTSLQQIFLSKIFFTLIRLKHSQNFFQTTIQSKRLLETRLKVLKNCILWICHRRPVSMRDIVMSMK